MVLVWFCCGSGLFLGSSAWFGVLPELFWMYLWLFLVVLGWLWVDLVWICCGSG